MMEMGVLLAFTLGMIGLYLVAWMLLIPMKTVGKLLINSVIGALTVILLNLAGGLFGFHIALNLLTAALVGLLGVPGVILCLFLF